MVLIAVDKRSLPDGWQWVRLGEVADYINGRAFKPLEWVTTGLPIIRIQNLTSPESSFNYFDGQVETRYLVGNGDLLVSWSASLDAFIWCRGPAILNQHIFKVAENDQIITKDYLYFALRDAMAEIRNQVHGATMRHITKPEFEAITIPLAPFPEQRRIAAILYEQMAAIEQARAACEMQVAAARALPAAYLREVFESAEAQQWPKKRLDDVCHLLPSKSIATTGDADVLTVTTACLTEFGFNPSGLKPARMWTQDVPACSLSAGEILVARSNTPDLVGRVALYQGIPSGVVASDLTIRVWPGNDVSGTFLAGYLAFLYLRGYWKERAGGASGSMKKITRTQICDLPVPTPGIAEQLKIKKGLSEHTVTAARTLQALQMQLDAINRLPAALLRRAFNGEL